MPLKSRSVAEPDCRAEGNPVRVANIYKGFALSLRGTKEVQQIVPVPRKKQVPAKGAPEVVRVGNAQVKIITEHFSLGTILATARNPSSALIFKDWARVIE